MSTSRRKRRSWSKEKKLAMLTEALDSSIFQVAQQNDVRPALLYLWRRKFSNCGQAQQPRKQATNMPSLEREYIKLAKLQAAVAAKLKKDLANGTVTSYAAGSTLINLYNGVTKLEGLQNEVTGELSSQRPNDLSTGSQVIPLEAQSRQREIQRMAEKALVEIEKYRIEKNKLEAADSQGQASAR